MSVVLGGDTAISLDKISNSIDLSGNVLYLDAGDASSYPGSGTTWYDISGNNNDGTLIGATYNPSDGGVMQFNGTSNLVRVVSSSVFKNNTNVTISIWCNFSSLTNPIYSLVNKGNQTSFNYFWLSLYNPLVYPNPNIGLMWEFGDGLGHQWQFNYLWTPTTNTWYNITVTFEPGSPKIYINGVLMAGSNYYITTPAPTFIGATQDGGTLSFNVGAYRDIAHWFDGKLNLPLFYRKTLSANEVLKLFNLTRARYGV